MGHVLHSPFRVPVSKHKTFTLNLNVFRNTHYRTLNKAKIAYKNIMRKPIETLPQLNKINLRIVIYPKTRALFDVGNIGSIHEKFFLDALVEFGKLKDDNYIYCPTIIYEFGEVDKHNPRVEIHINEV